MYDVSTVGFWVSAKLIRKRQQNPRSATSVDEIIGRQIRKRRRMLEMSQAELAAALGIAPQQVQKYENGTNRLSVGRVVQIAEALSAPVGWFFCEVDANAGGPSPFDTESFLTLFSFLGRPTDHVKLRAVATLLESTPGPARRQSRKAKRRGPQ